MRDTSCLNELYKKFCRDIQQWRFIELYDYAVSKPLGYLIIDFVSHTFKCRLNSLNLYFNAQTFKVDHIATDDEFREKQKHETERVNAELVHRFSNAGFNFNRGQKFNSAESRKHDHSAPQPFHQTQDAVYTTPIDSDRYADENFVFSRDRPAKTPSG